MNRSPSRRLVPIAQALLTLATIAGLMHCSGGELPPPAGEDGVDSGPGTTPPEAGVGIVSIRDVDPVKGLAFGDDGLVNCGTQAPAKSIVLKNSLREIVNFTATMIVGGQFYTVNGGTGGIPAGGEATVQIAPKAIPGESDVTNDLYAGTLEIALPGRGVTPQQVRLHMTARGAVVTLGAATYSLGAVKVGESKSLPVSLTNSGNLDVTASLAVGNAAYKVGGETNAVVALKAGATQSTPLVFSPPSAGDLPDALAISYNPSAVFCNEPPRQSAITGQGTTAVGISSLLLDFGQVNCNTTAPAQTLTIESTVSMKFTPVLRKGPLSPYTLRNKANGNAVASGTQITLAAASSYELEVVPKKIEPVSSTADNAFGDALTITTDVNGDLPRDIALRQTAKGAILSWSQATIATSARVDTLSNSPFSLINSGNTQVPYTVTTSPTSSFTSTLTTGNLVVGSTSGTLSTKAPSSAGTTVTGTMSVALGAAGGVLCADLPPAVLLSATGTGQSVSVNPSALNFGQVDCGTSGVPQTIQISSVSAAKVKVELGRGAGSYYTLADSADVVVPLNSEVNVAPGAPFILKVVPKQVAVPSGTTNNGLGDTLKLTRTDVVETPIDVPLSQTARGYSFSFPPSVAKKGTVTIVNNGNAIGRVTVSGSVGNPGTYDLGGGASVALIAADAEGTIVVTPAAGFPRCGNSGTSIAVQ